MSDFPTLTFADDELNTVKGIEGETFQEKTQQQVIRVIGIIAYSH